jgi:hypothetical protein
MVHGGRELVYEGPLPAKRQVVDRERANGTSNEIAGQVNLKVGDGSGEVDAQKEGLAQGTKRRAQRSGAA